MTGRLSTRAFLGIGLLLAVLVAGVASYYASADPDGLDYVAEQTGFLDSAEDSPASDSPLADYQTRGVEDERASVAVAGIVGVGVMAVLSTGLFWLIRRREPDASDEA